jgi:hypothetical protein
MTKVIKYAQKISTLDFIENIPQNLQLMGQKEANCVFDLNNRYLSGILDISFTEDRFLGEH